MPENKTVELKKDLYYVGSLDPELRIFDIVMYTPFGSSYNSYLLKGTKANVLIETVKASDKFYNQMIDKIDNVLGEGEKIDYIIHNHTEPDHSGCSERILAERYPDATVIGSSTAVKYLKQIGNEKISKFKYVAAQKIKKLDIGGYTLEFHQAPFLHWPDSMFTFVPELKTIFTCDFLGSHFCWNDVVDKNLMEEKTLKDYDESSKYYYDCIFGPFKPYVLKGIDIMKKLKKNTGLEMVCNSHGPVLSNPKLIDRVMDKYEKWSQPQQLKDKVTIVYVSAYGYTGEIGQQIAKAIEKQGLEVKIINLLENSVEEALKEISDSKGFLIGSPTVVNDTLPNIWDLLKHLNPMVNMGQFAGTFGSFGWTGEATRNIDQRLQQIKLKLPLQPFKINFRPSKKDLETKILEYGDKFARAIKGEKIDERKKSKTESTKKGKTVYPNDGKLRKWKCIVCGEVFISKIPPSQCPACSAEGDIWVCEGVVGEEGPVSEENKKAMEYKGVVGIIGGGGAGVSAVKSIRDKNSICKVQLFSEEGLPYFRPSLTKGGVKYIENEKWYKDNNVELIQEKVIKVDKDKKKIYTEKNQFDFNKLILSTGATCRNPFFKPGEIPENFITLRTRFDFQELLSKKFTNPVIIGGGVLGIELSELLLTNYQGKDDIKNITMIEIMNRILPRQLDENLSDVIENKLKNHKIQTITSAQIEKIELSNDKKNAQKIIFKDGTVLETDLVVASCGVIPNLEIAKSLNLDISRGIVCDEKMETSEKDIFASGDCAQYKKMFVPNWGNAVNQGKIAGYSAIGYESNYKFEPSPFIIKAFDFNIFSMGNVNEEKFVLNSMKDEYKKFVFDKENQLIGALVMSDKYNQIDLVNAITGSMKYVDVITNFLN